MEDVGGIKGHRDMYVMKESEIEDLCKQIRKTVKPSTSTSSTRGGSGGSNYFTFSFLAEKNLKLLCSEVKILYLTGRDADTIYNAVTDDIEAWQSRREEMAAFKDPKSGEPEAMTISKNWVKGFEILEQWIGNHVDDVTNMPLAFVIREKDEDRSDYNPSNYQGLADEFAKRTPLTNEGSSNRTVTYRNWTVRCQNKVWRLLYSVFKDHAAFQYMKPYKRAQDGRAAFLALKSHYLGPNNVNNMATDLETQFEGLTYNQETRRWNFEKYAGKHVELFNTAEDLKEHGYAGLDPSTRVRRLLNGIKTDKLDSVKTRIMSDSTLQSDFDRCVNLFKDFIAQRKSLQMAPTSQIAGVVTEKGNRKDKTRGKKDKRSANVAGVDVKDRFYTPEEYAKLSADERSELYKLRKKRRENGAGGNGKASAADIRALTAQVQALVSSSERTGNDGGGSNAGDGNDNATQQVNNRTNPALTRQRGNGRS